MWRKSNPVARDMECAPLQFLDNIGEAGGIINLGKPRCDAGNSLEILDDDNLYIAQDTDR